MERGPATLVNHPLLADREKKDGKAEKEKGACSKSQPWMEAWPHWPASSRATPTGRPAGRARSARQPQPHVPCRRPLVWLIAAVPLADGMPMTLVRSPFPRGKRAAAPVIFFFFFFFSTAPTPAGRPSPIGQPGPRRVVQREKGTFALRTRTRTRARARVCASRSMRLNGPGCRIGKEVLQLFHFAPAAFHFTTAVRGGSEPGARVHAWPLGSSGTLARRARIRSFFPPGAECVACSPLGPGWLVRVVSGKYVCERDRGWYVLTPTERGLRPCSRVGLPDGSESEAFARLTNGPAD